MTQEVESLITDEMRATVGVAGEPVIYEVDRTGIRMFARAVQHVDQIYYDEAYAKSKGHRDIVAPPGYYGTPIYNPKNPVRGPGTQLGAHGKPLRSLNGGSEFEFTGVDICAGDTITAVAKVVSVTERKASLGMMVITRRETTYTNQLGEVVGRSYGTNLAY
jgi:hypothetical protein